MSTVLPTTNAEPMTLLRTRLSTAVVGDVLDRMGLRRQYRVAEQTMTK